MFMKIYVFSLCITLAFGVAAYTTVFPEMAVQNPDISNAYNELNSQLSFFLNGDFSSFADGFFASAFIIYTALKIAILLLINGPAIVTQTVSYFSLPSALVAPILFMNMIAFIGTMYNIVRGLRAIMW